MADLSGKHILAVLGANGVEQDEITQPREQLRAHGASVTVAAPTSEPIKSLISDWDLGEEIPVDITLEEVNNTEYDLLFIPGGTLNADSLRLNEHAQQITTAFMESKRPVAAICHGPWLLVETGVISGKQATSYISLRTDIINAGGTWHNEELMRCGANDWTLLTSRGPQDLPVFIKAIEDELTAA